MIQPGRYQYLALCPVHNKIGCCMDTDTVTHLVTTDELYPFHELRSTDGATTGTAVEVKPDTLARYERVMKEFVMLQQELKQVADPNKHVPIF